MALYRMALRRASTLGPRAISAASVALCVALTVLAVKTPWSPLPRPVIAASGLVGAGALWFRGRWPVGVAALAAVAHALSGNPAPLLISLFSAARVGTGWRLPVLAVIGVAGLLAPEWVGVVGSLVSEWVGVAGLLDPEWAGQARLDANAFVSALAGTAVAMAVGGYAATRRELTTSLRERAERAEAEQRLRNEQARTAERSRIAREMHDVLGHKITLISLHAGGLEVNAHARPARIEQGAALIRATAQEALEELRNILGVLRSEHGDSFEELPDLRRLVDSWARTGTEITLNGDIATMPVATARAAYRLVQEGLTNAHKHAPGTAVTISVSKGEGDDVTITVVNERPRLHSSQAPSPGVGLVGLAERLRLIGGTLHSGPDDAGGWRLEGRLPREPSDQDTGGG